MLEYQTDVRMCRFDKPSSLLRPYVADTSALPMLELGFMPVVTTIVPADNFSYQKESFEHPTRRQIFAYTVGRICRQC